MVRHAPGTTEIGLHPIRATLLLIACGETKYVLPIIVATWACALVEGWILIEAFDVPLLWTIVLVTVTVIPLVVAYILHKAWSSPD